jgi:hypothetical protein
MTDTLAHMTDRELLARVVVTAEAYADAVSNEMELEDGRTAVKMAAIERIMQSGDNPLTGKAHSFSSAEALVNIDAVYAAYLAKMRDAVRQKIMARGNYETAILATQLCAGVQYPESK